MDAAALGRLREEEAQKAREREEEAAAVEVVEVEQAEVVAVVGEEKTTEVPPTRTPTVGASSAPRWRRGSSTRSSTERGRRS